MKKSLFITISLILTVMLAILPIINIVWAEEHTYEENEKAKYEKELKERLEKYAAKDTKLKLQNIFELEGILFQYKSGNLDELLDLVDAKQIKILSSRLEKAKKGMSKKDLINLKKSLNYAHTRLQQVAPKELTPKELIALDKLLCTKWAEMKEALSNNDIEKVLSYFSLYRNKAFRFFFSAMSPEKRAKFIQDHGDIRFIREREGIATYAIKTNFRGKEVLVHLLFKEEYNGEWKIESSIIFD